MGLLINNCLLHRRFKPFTKHIPRGFDDAANNAHRSSNLETIIFRPVIRTREHPGLDGRMKLGAIGYISGATHVGRENNGFPFSIDKFEALEDR